MSETKEIRSGKTEVEIKTEKLDKDLAEHETKLKCLEAEYEKQRSKKMCNANLSTDALWIVAAKIGQTMIEKYRIDAVLHTVICDGITCLIKMLYPDGIDELMETVFPTTKPKGV